MGLSVMVVDDSRTMRRIVLRALKMGRLPITRVEEAGCGEEALDIAARVPPDLALVDLHMPGMGGLELIRKLRANEATAGMALVIVSSDATHLRAAQKENPDVPFVHKPFQAHDLIEAVAQARVARRRAAS